MAGGGKVRIADRDNFGEMARVVNGRLLVSGSGGGAGTDVNIDAVGGTPIGSTVPVSGTVTANQGTTPWVVGDGGGSLTVDGAVSITNFPAVQPVSGTVTANQGTSPWVIGDGGGSITVDGTVSITGSVAVTGPIGVTQVTSPWITQGTLVDFDVGVGAGLNFPRDEDTATTLQTGILPIARTVSDIGGNGLGEGSWTKLYANTNGALWVQVAGTTPVSQGSSPWVIGDGGGSITVDGTVTVNQGTSPWVVSLTSTTITGTVAVTQSTSPWVTSLASTTLTSVVPGTGATNLGKAEDAVHASGDTGVFALAVRSDVATALAANGDYIPFIVDSTGRLHCNVSNTVTVSGTVAVSAITTSVTPGNGAANLGKAEDQAAVSGDTGVMALGVRSDTPAATAANGDYVPFLTDSKGRLWVNATGEITQTINFSSSTHGRPVQIAATGAPGTKIHDATTTTGLIDKIFLWLTNTSGATVLCTIEYGVTGASANVKVLIPANETVLVLDGTCIGGNATSDTVAVFADTTNVINAFGRVERLTNPT